MVAAANYRCHFMSKTALGDKLCCHMISRFKTQALVSCWTHPKVKPRVNRPSRRNPMSISFPFTRLGVSVTTQSGSV